VRFICVILHDAMMKRSNSSLTKDDILAFRSLLVVQATCPCYEIIIREGLGSFFFVAIHTIGGGIYLHFLSWCSDEEE
jgi:hypothetical protein